MVNKILLEGVVVSTIDRLAESKSFFVNIRQKRKLGNFELTDSFQIYANEPIASELKTISIEGNVISIEGVLKTYRAKDGQYKMSIEVKKIIQ
jgi:hypothetical protein